MPQEWYVLRGEVERGPLTSKTLKQLASNGVVVATDLVRTTDMPEWRKAAMVKGLFIAESSGNAALHVQPPTHDGSTVVSTTPVPDVEWYYAKGGKRFGPISQADLMDLSAKHELSANVLVWKKGWSEWKPLKTLKELVSGNPSFIPVPPSESATKADENTQGSQTTVPVTDDIVEHWFYQKSDQQFGPILLKDLAALAAKGKISPTDLIRHKDSKWIAVESILGSPPDQLQIVNENEWYYGCENSWIGPRTFNELRRFAASGFFSQSTLITKKGTKSIVASWLISDFRPEKVIQQTADIALNGNQHISATFCGLVGGMVYWLFLGGGFIWSALLGSGLGFGMAYLSDKCGLNLRPYHTLHNGSTSSNVNLRFIGSLVLGLVVSSHFSGTSAQYQKGYENGRRTGISFVPKYRQIGLLLDEEHVVEEMRSYRNSTAAVGVRFEDGADPSDEEYWDGWKDGYASVIE